MHFRVLPSDEFIVAASLVQLSPEVAAFILGELLRVILIL